MAQLTRDHTQAAACPSARRRRTHHLSTSNPPGSPVVPEKAFLSLRSDVLEAERNLTGSSPRQSQPSASLLSLLLFTQEMLPSLWPILPVCSLSPLRAGTLPPIFTLPISFGSQAPALGCCRVPMAPADWAPSEEQLWVPNRVCIGEGAALGEVSLHHSSPPRQAAPDPFKAIVTRRLCSIAPSKGSGSSCAKLT